jgi:hypothetical protein
MKIRTGFVANSSSSSFVLALPAALDISSVEAIHDYLYGPAGTPLSLERIGVPLSETEVPDFDAVWDAELEAAFSAVHNKNSVAPTSPEQEESLPQALELLEAADAKRPHYTTAISSREAAQAVWQRLAGQAPNEEGTLALWSRLNGGPKSDAFDRYIAGAIDKPTFEREWARYQADCVAYARAHLDAVIGPDAVLYEVEFVDYGGDDLGVIMRNAPDNLGGALRWELSIG